MKNQKIIFFLIIICIPSINFFLLKKATNHSFVSISQLKMCSPEIIWRREIVEDWCLPVRISSDGNYIVAGGQNVIWFFHRSSPNPKWEARLEIPVYISISEDGHYISAGNNSVINKKLLLFSHTNSTPLWSYEFSGSSYERIITEISKDGNYIVGGKDKYLRFFHRSSSKPIWNYTIPSYWLTSLALSANGNFFVSGDVRSINFFNYTSSNPEWTYDFNDNVYTNVDISSNGEFIIAGNHLGCHLFNRNGHIWSYTKAEFTNTVISSDGEYIASASGANFSLFHKSSSTPNWTYIGIKDIDSLEISSNGSYIVAGAHRDLCYFNISSPTPLWNWSVPEGGIKKNSVDISSNGRWVAVGGGEYWGSALYLIDGFKSIPEQVDNEENGEDEENADGNGGDKIIPGYNILLIFGILSIITVISIKRQRKFYH